jgi:hypothetical protein
MTNGNANAPAITARAGRSWWWCAGGGCGEPHLNPHYPELGQPLDESHFSPSFLATIDCDLVFVNSLQAKMASESQPKYIYKILPHAPAEPFPTALPFSPLDAKDGFVHLSTAEQVSPPPNQVQQILHDSADALHLIGAQDGGPILYRVIKSLGGKTGIPEACRSRQI